MDSSSIVDIAVDGAHFAMNLHPGVMISLKRMNMDELSMAEAIRDDQLTSPQRYENISLVNLRITGTDTAYRKALDEYVFRRPENYLNETFLRRCQGLPIIMEHPKGNKLDSNEFSERVVGTMFIPYLKGDEVWGIAKIYDDIARDMIDEEKLSTSPAVVFRDPSVNEKVTLDDGSTLLIEGKPSLLDHLAICERGVWDKGGEPTGVTSTTYGDSVMPTEEEKKMEEDKARKDAEAGEKLDKILSHMDSLSKRMDAFEEKGRKDGNPDPSMDEPAETATDAEKEEWAAKDKAHKDKAKKDAEEEAEKADKAKKDAETEEEKMALEKAEEAKKDAEMEGIKKKIADMDEKMPKEMSDADYAEMADAQAKADSVASAFGTSASRPLNGEGLLAYRKRMARGFQKHSKTWSEVDMYVLPKSAFEIAEAAIYADAMQAARTPTDLPVGTLREIRQTDRAGRTISTFHGDMNAWMNDFKSTKRRLVGINKGA